MKRLAKSWAWAAVFAAALISLGAPGARAQGGGSIAGTILDVVGKPWYNVPMECVSDQGAKQETKTDENGKYSFHNLRPGVYHVYIILPAPNKPFDMQIQVGSDQESKADMNFKDVVAKQGAAAEEQVKKQAEEKQKFESMKTHFTAGTAILVQERKAKEDLQKAAPDQRDALKQNLKDLSDKAAAEFQEAQKAAPEHDANQHLLWATLGEAYDLAGRNDEAAQAYQQAINAKPDDPGYYNNLGNVLARAGKIDEAKAAYTKSAELDPTHAATAWRNFGISLYNANRLGDAVEPLQKSAELDPKNAQTWYLLGASLVYKMTVKKVGDKDVPEFAPGTIEAYQKAIELDPNGPYGQDAKKGLEQLQLMAPGVDIKVNVKKKKS
ncbi:MAG TPA: tetratricopeptide repeat protein [Candidatus Solibacter sp.]|nr:tetratricopeptide repeat protein [Candidatus Solibacter sp.]